MTAEDAKKMREYIMARTARGSRTQALAALYEDVLDEISSNPSADARALARAAIGADRHDDAG